MSLTGRIWKVRRDGGWVCAESFDKLKKRGCCWDGNKRASFQGTTVVERIK